MFKKELIENIMLKQKIRADNINTLVLLIGYLILTMFLKLIFFMSIIVYPMVVLLIFGIFKIREGLVKKPREPSIKALIFLYGIVCILFGYFMLSVIFTQPNVGLSEAIYLFAFVVIIFGIAGIVKGIVIKEYLSKYRNINIIIGIITVIFAFNAFIFGETGFLFHVIILILTLFLNFIFRAVMYLSEYGLSLKKIRNLKVMFYIINDYNELEIIRRLGQSKIAKN